jgi:hypothetical protein
MRTVDDGSCGGWIASATDPVKFLANIQEISIRLEGEINHIKGVALVWLCSKPAYLIV